MKKWVFLLIALLAVVSLAACGGGDEDSDNKTDNGNGNGTTTEKAQWAAYKFDDNVKAASGGSGTIDTFTMESAYSDSDGLRKFKIEGDYQGRETTAVVSQKMVVNTTTGGFAYENVSTSLDCYKIKHRVSVISDTTGDKHPAWADITVWIPAGASLETSSTYFQIYPKMSYVDSEGDTGEYSWYLTDAMQADKTSTYLPYGDGDFGEYDTFAFFGLYGWGWWWFKDFAEGGTREMEEGTWSVPGYAGCSWDTDKLQKKVGAYTFDAWSMKYSCTTQGASTGWEGTFSEDLCLPIYAKFGSSGGSSSVYWEYTLTDVKLA